ncbi:inositol monophosphatase [Candidatus Sulfidibacterium hydrothermale]|uniref:inositol monophosphatase family protein n=1 Tax=Candidatus Sulfidibacterium hydrothermale TaxID=2875962 RepID=UPI001F0A3578|nr:inositol monophosphatase family protein [Candidatus Sulfidibacterium hydrothermale]UBM61299.1 inositol monophosphatase [Candidatus Sulfidibacterium hydrothermale]
MDLEKMTQQVVSLCQTVGKMIRDEVNRLDEQDVEYKGVHNLVTYVDKKSEEILIKELKKLLPEAGFIAEEDDKLARGSRFNWIVDPLDGTTNFIHKIPLYSISIALNDGEETILGVVHEINLEESFYAWKNGPALLNGKEIRVTDTEILDKSLIATGFPYYDYSKLDPYLDLFKDLMQSSRGVRRLGSAAVDLAYVAAGRFELFYEYGLNPWDVAAGALIVKQAGGQITRFNGDGDYVFGKEIVASNTRVHNEFLRKLSQYFFS